MHARTQDGDTPLHLAARRAHLGVAKLLLRAGADVGVSNRDGYSASALVQPLHRHSMLRDALREAEVALAISTQAALATTVRRGSVEHHPALISDRTEISTAMSATSGALEMLHPLRLDTALRT